MIKLIRYFAQGRLFWALLVILGVVLEGCGLYFQYGLNLDPCVNCVYERALYLTFIAAGIIALINPKNRLWRFLGEIIFFIGSLFGIMIAFSHLADYTNDGFGASCKLRADFPSFFKLDEWLPWMFKPTGACIKLDWSLFSFNMPQWILLSFVCGTVVALIFIVTEPFAHREERMRYY